jgi:hypothetical protein
MVMMKMKNKSKMKMMSLKHLRLRMMRTRKARMKSDLDRLVKYMQNPAQMMKKRDRSIYQDARYKLIRWQEVRT